MATLGSRELGVLLSTLQGSVDAGSTLSILNKLDELLSAGTDRRIRYMISKGGSETLLGVLVEEARASIPDYSVLLPLLSLLAKLGPRDRRIGQKAQAAGAVLLTLDLLRQNLKCDRRATACLLVLRVFCSSVSTAVLIGKNRGLDIVFKLIAPHTTKHIQMVKAAIDTLAAIFHSKANSKSAAAKGYISCLLKLYEDWHLKDRENCCVPIRRALLHCLHCATNTRAGMEALLAEEGMTLLFQSTQACLGVKCLDSLTDSAVQLMRKCHPKCPVPLTSDQSVYSFPLPRRLVSSVPTDPEVPDDRSENDSDDDSTADESDHREYDDDLEIDLEKLRNRPEPDRPLEQLGQYVRLCPELRHDFPDLDSSSEVDGSSDEELVPNGEGKNHCKQQRISRHQQERGGSSSTRPLEKQATAEEVNTSPFHEGGGPAENHCLGRSKRDSHSMVDRLLERHRACIPHHDPRKYAANAAQTKSIAGYSILAFPDFWGHLPPSYQEPMASRKPNVQRQKVLEDIRRFLCPDDVIDRVVFDLEDPSYEYDLILNADVNCSHHLQWFYFEVSGMQANVSYRFNIINCEKANTQFNYGMQPVLFSVCEALLGQPHWLRVGSEICYFRNHFSPSDHLKGPSYYTLSFNVTFPHSDDVCYLAYHYPYTYSTLQTHLQMLERSVDPCKVFFRQQSLCSSLGGNPCPLVTITACPPSRSWSHLYQLRNRPYVVLTARVHPGESNASWVMKGTLEFLCSGDPVAEGLREAYIFKILPMLNPDGAINGMHRCSLNGEDLNRQWMKPDLSLSPTIYHTKGFLLYLSSIGRTPLVFCDYHGHSRKKNVFLYGCSVKETLWQSGSTVNTATLKEDPGYRSIPKTLDRISPAFSFNSCNYLVEKSREATARVVVWRELGVLRSYTLESTYNGCDQGIYKGLQTGTKELEETGLRFCQSLLSLRRNTLISSRKFFSHASALLDLDDSLLDHKSHNSFEDDEPPCEEEIEYLSKRSPEFGGNMRNSEVNGNVSSSEEDADEEEWWEEPRNGLLHPDRKPDLIPHLKHEASPETLHISRGMGSSIDIVNGEHLLNG
ncbi:cytosolic carboxypeptidase 4-like isoform X2 [Conger conger]|uniref:cytosolic carboxypeptidase 4-like isoform X2 n=1 Tax=Conger conger TaxID=82655 RepID=UPI002A5AD30B|nr:cytosolic carboxypeptidase 4-like isoform X2 [Conger conger]